MLQSQRDPRRAVELYLEQEQLARELDWNEGLASALVSRAWVLALQLEDAESAIPLMDEAHKLIGNHGLSELDDILAELRQQMAKSSENAQPPRAGAVASD